VFQVLAIHRYLSDPKHLNQVGSNQGQGYNFLDVISIILADNTHKLKAVFAPNLNRLVQNCEVLSKFVLILFITVVLNKNIYDLNLKLNLIQMYNTWGWHPPPFLVRSTQGGFRRYTVHKGLELSTQRVGTQYTEILLYRT